MLRPTPTPHHKIELLWNRPESLFLKMLRPPDRKIELLWNRPESLFLKMLQDLALKNRKA
ncbi:hypothetical protein [Microcoleus sp. B4-C5]|uniref:hypothetical protein n=1 Tax=Microcoleus sp. B4-C5 TaxID=2818664 RepID=UPI002FD3144B